MQYNFHNLKQKGKNMLKDLFKRIKSQKGMSGVLVALLLVLVGVGLVAGLNTYMTDIKDEIVVQTDLQLKDAGIVVTP